MRGGQVHFNLALGDIDAGLTDVSSDEAVMLYSQYSTHWDGFAHKGALFDADGDGVAEKVFYNGHAIVDPQTGEAARRARSARGRCRSPTWPRPACRDAA